LVSWAIYDEEGAVSGIGGGGGGGERKRQVQWVRWAREVRWVTFLLSLCMRLLSMPLIPPVFARRRGPLQGCPLDGQAGPRVGHARATRRPLAWCWKLFVIVVVVVVADGRRLYRARQQEER
jgi:hypothetical protein